jgi:YebC/PmpR family DNA-binding regulatory protein
MGKGWKNPIKAALAAKKGALFTKFAREISVAARIGGPDPEANSRLKLAIAVAREASCPKDTIERAIKKGSGQTGEGDDIEELTYEGYGPHGVGIVVECQTNNRNRTVSEMRSIFKSHGGNMGESGAVSWMFERVSLVTGRKAVVEDAETSAIEAGADDVQPGEEAGLYDFYGSPDSLDELRQALQNQQFEIVAAELSYRPKNITELTEEQKKEVVELLTALEENEDSHRVFATV